MEIASTLRVKPSRVSDFILVSLIFFFTAFGTTSCNKDNGPTAIEETAVEEQASLTLKIKGNMQTKADPDTQIKEGEATINTIDLFIFDMEEGSLSEGMLEAYKKVTVSGTDETTIKMNSTTGKKRIYAVANAATNANGGGSFELAKTVETEEDLLSSISKFSENALSDFIMVGSASTVVEGEAKEPVLEAGAAAANNITIEVKRLVSRIKIGSIKGDFTAPGLREKDFVVKRIYLMNVAKQANYVNGSWKDVFGDEQRGTITEAPEGFKAAVEVGKYYAYAAPTANSSQPDGFWNWMDHTTYQEGTPVVLSNDEAVKALTLKEYTADQGLIYSSDQAKTPLEGNTMNLGEYFYAYPNSSVPATKMEDVDMTTKLVIETQITIDSEPITYYYPLSIPYLQPNYAYTIGTVTIHRLGSKDPFHPVSTANCSFTITVQDWDTGEIVGQFNNEVEGSEGDFEI